MSAKLIQEYPTNQTSSRSFRFMFTLMYIGIIGTIAYFNGLGRCDSHFIVGGNAELAVLLLLLLAVERFEQKRYGDVTPPGIAVALLVARMVLFEGVVALDCSGISIFLYPIIPFSAYFAFGETVSNLLTLLYLLIGVWRTWRLDNVWYMNAGIASNLIAFVFVLILMQVVAPVIRRDDQNRRRTEQLLADLKVSHLKLQAYAEEVAELAATEERNRLARDIHDSLGHYLTAVNIQLEKALVYRERDPEEAAQAIQDAKHAAAQALADVRHSVGALRNAENHFSLKAALEDLVQGIDSDRCAIDLTVTGDETGYARSILMALYRAAQEGLTNTQKHAQASHIVLDVQFGEQEARLTLRDDGQGFDTSVLEELTSPQFEGFGLQGIRERLELIRGQMALKSNPKQGTELSVTVPKKLTVGGWHFA
jgi:signal transduction histidine kinase